MPRQPDHNEAVQHLAAADKYMEKLVAEVGPCTLEIRHHFSIFYSLLRSIIYQQLAGAAAATILGRVERAVADGKRPTPDQILSAPDDVLRGAGLSRNKMAAVRDLAAKTLDGTVPDLSSIRRLSDEDIIEHITQVRGIGRWTVEMLLIFRLGRPDVLPLDDLGVRKGFQLTYRMRDLPTKDQMIRRTNKWRPWRSIGSWYMWRALELPSAKRN